MANEYIKKDYAGAAAATTLATAISGSALTIVVASGGTYPDGTAGPFVIVLDRGTGSEEKVLCASRSGNTITVTERGYDGTTQTNHSVGATIEHCLDAYSIKQANTFVNTPTTRGDIVVLNSLGQPARLAVGGASTVLVSNGSDPSWSQLSNAHIASGAAIAASKLAAATPGQLLVAHTGDGVPTFTTVTGPVTIDGAGLTAIGNNAITAAMIGTGIITSSHILDGTLVDGDINGAAAIAYSKLALGGKLKNTDFSAAAAGDPGVWTSYTPTLGGTGWAVGNGTLIGAYTTIGKTTFFWAMFTAGTTSTFGAAARPTLTFPPPAAEASLSTNFQCGLAAHCIVGSFFPLFAQPISATTMDFTALTASGTYVGLTGVSATVPGAWSSGQILRVSGWYEN